ncbi:unnamed protein product [Amoebophrya sp. A25]|nr:unnamed protein product [Amoebophrya sp. A25]|eukprot:GSA25T00007087001.1
MAAAPFLKAGLQSGTILTIADVLTQLGIEGKSFEQKGGSSSSSSTSPSQSGSPPAPNAKNTTPTTAVYDPYRTARWTGAGLMIHGPYFFYTFGKIDKLFANYTLNLTTVLLKTATAQFTAFPGYLALLFAYMGAAEGMRDPEKIKDNVLKRVPEAFAAGCVFWPVANTINFSVVSASYRVPYLASCGSVWGCVLSLINARGKREGEAGGK